MLANIWSFVMAHSAAVALTVKSILDLIILVNPKLQAGGTFEMIYLWISGQSQKSS